MKRIIVVEQVYYDFAVEDDEFAAILDERGELDSLKAEDWFCNKDNPYAEATYAEVSSRDFDAGDEA